MKNCSWTKSWNWLCAGQRSLKGEREKKAERLSFFCITANKLLSFTALPLAKHARTQSWLINRRLVGACVIDVSGSCPQAAFCSAALRSISYSVSDSENSLDLHSRHAACCPPLIRHASIAHPLPYTPLLLIDPLSQKPHTIDIWLTDSCLSVFDN